MKFTICIAVGALLMSCQTAPRVSADLTAHLPARSADSVMIFKTTEAVPASAQVIGTVKVKDSVWIGAGAIVINNVNICGECTIGAGAVVITDISNPGTYIGVPAKKTEL